MAQNSLQEKIEQLKNAQKVPEQKALWQQLYERTQPIAWQGAISWLSSSQKRKLRWSNAKDAAKWAVSSLYSAAEFIPWTLARMWAAWVDQTFWTDYQSKIDDSLNYIPAKLRQSSNNTKAFDKWEEFTNDALTAAALLTAWASWPKWPRAKLRDVAKNPTKYSLEEASQIIKENVWLKPTATEKVMQSIWDTTSNVLQKIWDTKLWRYLQDKEVQNAIKKLNENTSKARAEKLKSTNLRWTELEQDAAAALNDAKNMSLEDMFKLWKSQQNW